jgi:hypothetical protein
MWQQAKKKTNNKTTVKEHPLPDSHNNKQSQKNNFG